MRRRDGSGSERLRRANPVTTEDAPGPDSATGLATFEGIMRSGPTPRRRRWRRSLWIVVPATVLVLGTVSYAVYRTVSEPNVVVCYGGPSLNGTRAAVPPAAAGPLAACQHLWDQGGQFSVPGRPAPGLTACLLSSGAIGVFPQAGRSDLCSALGLPGYVAERTTEEDRSITAVHDELVPSFLGTCLDEQRAELLVGASLRRHGLTGWRVTAGAFSAAAPCASLAFDPATRQVLIVPVAGPSTP